MMKGRPSVKYTQINNNYQLNTIPSIPPPPPPLSLAAANIQGDLTRAATTTMLFL